MTMCSRRTGHRWLVRAAMIGLVWLGACGGGDDPAGPAVATATPLPASPPSTSSADSSEVAVTTVAPSLTTIAAAAPGLESLSLDLLAPAVAAVEADRGGPQQYTEINVQPGFVNLFVALDDGTELAYVFKETGLEVPTEATPQPEGIAAYGLDGIDVSAVSGFDEMLQFELPNSSLGQLSLLALPNQGVMWNAAVVSIQGGGILDVLISANGEIVDVTPRA
jgi:hypothetical protein